MSLADTRWIDIQQNTFTNWCNSCLKGTDKEISDLITDLDDGVRLIVLLEQLARRTVAERYHENPRLPIHGLENLEKAFIFMEKAEGIYMVNIGPIDIREHNRRIILGLIWHLILHYQIFGYRRQSTNTPTRPVRSPTPKPLPKSANKVLMNWLRAAMPEDCKVKNVTSSWNDGKNLSALVNTMKPGLCPNYASLSPSDALPNTKKAMDQAEKEFDIPQIIDPEHLCIDEPDKLSCMTYLSYFCSGDDSPGYNSLLEWVRSKIPDYNIENFTDDWRDGRALSALVNAIAEGTVPNHAELDPSKGVDNIRRAMKTADDNLDGIENNITPEEFADKRTDALAMMGYIEWFRKARPKQRESLSAVGPDELMKGAKEVIKDKEEVIEDKEEVIEDAGEVMKDSKEVTKEKEEVIKDTKDMIEEKEEVIKDEEEVLKDAEEMTLHEHAISEMVDKPSTPVEDPPILGHHDNTEHGDLPQQHTLVVGWGWMEGSQERLDDESDETEVNKFTQSAVVMATDSILVGTPTNFTVDCHRAGPGSLQVTINSPSGADVPATITGDSTYNVQYTPEEAGPHNIVILYADHQVKGSPFTAIVYDPSKVVASGDGLSHGVTGEKAEFTICTEGAGPGKPVVKVNGPTQNVPCDVEEVDEHLYKCTYTPEEEGIHHINIVFADEDVPGSPFTAQVESPSFFDQVTVKDVPKGKLYATRLYSVTVDATQAGRGGVRGVLESSSSSAPVCSVLESVKNVYSVRFTPSDRGKLTLHLYYGNREIPSSPLNFNVLDIRDITLTPPTPGKLGVFVVDHPYSYIVSTSDTSEPVMVTAYGSHTGTKVAADISYLGNAKYKATVICPKVDGYDVLVYYGEEPVNHARCRLNVMDKPHPEYAVCTQPTLIMGVVILEADVSKSGPGGLTAIATGDRTGSVPVEVKTKSRGHRSLSFKAATPDLYRVNVLWNDIEVPGSPFTVDTRPHPSRVVASGDGLSHGVTGEKAEFTIRTEGAGPGKPVVKVMGPTQNVPCDVEEVDEHLYKCTYTPEEEGVHHINIVFADEDVPGSPFTAQVEEAIPVDAHKVKVDGPHCPQMHRGPVSGVCDVSEAGDGQLTATCYSKMYGDVPVEVGPRENGSHKVLFNPPGKDVFHLSVLWSGDHVPGSPFDIDLNPPLANEVRVDGPHPCPDGIGPVHAYIDTSDAGDGVLDVKSSGERLGPVEVKVVEKDSCVYDASFEAFQPDIYHMDVKWSGVHVPGSTFRIPVDLGEGLCTQEVLEDVESAYVPASFSDVYDSGESKEYQELDIPESIPLFHVGEKLSVTMDKEGQGDAGHVTADCRGDTAGPVPVNMTKNSDGTYTATIDPRVPDLYTVNVLMDGEHVPSSPFKVRYLPPQTDATKCRVYNRPPPEKRLIAHDDIMYNVDASKAGAGVLTVQSEGPSGGKTNTNLQVVPKEGSDFKIIYTPTKAGTHKHYIYWSKEAIPDSPVEFEVSPRDIPVYPWSKVIGIDYEFLGLKPKDLSGHVIYQPTGKKLKLSVEKNKAEPEKAHVTFKPTDAGIYEIHILHHKNHVRGSPFKVHILKPPNPNKVKVNGLEDAKCYIGDSVAFSVDCTEAGTGELLVKADSPSKDDEPSQLDIVDNHNNSYDGTYIPSTVGAHQLHVKWADQPVPGSPFTIKVQSDGSKEEIGTTNDPSKCFILPEDLEVMSTPFEHNQLVNFRVSTLNAGPGTLNVTSRGPSKADVVITDNKDGIYSVKFSPSEPGKYKLDVTWDDVNIKGSPFEVMVNGDSDRWAITGMNLSNIQFALNEKHPFTVFCDDLGEGLFDVQVEPPTDASITIRDLGKQTYHVTLVPKEPGVHKVSVLHSNQHILGSPFSCQFQQLGDASKCRLLEDAEEQQHEVGEEVSFMVTTEGAGPGTLSASVENVQKKTSRPADVKQLDETTYRVTFDPGQEEEYLLSIKYDNAHIVGSPCSLILEH